MVTMTTIAELLGEKAQEVRRATGAPTTMVKGNPMRLHAVAAASALPGCPLKRDGNGRLRQGGKFVKVT